MSKQPTQYVSIQSIARDLDVTPEYVRKAITAGELRAVKLGSMVRIPMSEYLAWHDTLRASTKK